MGIFLQAKTFNSFNSDFYLYMNVHTYYISGRAVFINFQSIAVLLCNFISFLITPTDRDNNNNNNLNFYIIVAQQLINMHRCATKTIFTKITEAVVPCS